MHQGVSLEAFLHAYRAALFGYWDACAEEASRLDISRAAGLALARFALDAIDTVTTHAARRTCVKRHGCERRADERPET